MSGWNTIKYVSALVAFSTVQALHGQRDEKRAGFGFSGNGAGC